MNPTTLGDHVRKRRLDLGLTQRQVAGQMGANVTSVRNWEGNATAPALWFIPEIVRFLGYTPLAPAGSIGERVRAWRRERGISQEALAGRLKVDPGTVRRWERGRSRPKTVHLSALQGLELG